ncbi:MULTISPECIES: DUF805 domain-containing protein [unclassified Isoptericola]|uniref:DUF805 domain-containing protein n=1 Tax=unclassified Isoptericola TaxID=2623355 RepID=UPI003658C652
MSFQDAIKTVFSQYATFTGRARRSEFWYFYLFVVLVNIITNSLDRMLFENAILNSLAALALLLPQLAVGARRLHDTGKSGFRLFWAFLPIIGWIMLIVWWAQDSQPGANQYGENPKGAQTGAPYGAPAA